MSNDLARRSIDTIRFLSADAIEKAASGHPGLPMGAAAMAYALWTRHRKHAPTNPTWSDRDRFVLSGGHGSMLLYSLLHLTGYDLSLDDLASFRQWGSRTPGHPESFETPGVDATTGPLGQGFATAVGMAIAEAHLAARYNRPGHDVVDHRTFVLASDGDLMEGVCAEASSLAGHLGLGKLIVLYDDNQISLAASTSVAFTEDVGARYEALGWHVERVGDGDDVEAVDRALQASIAETAKPSIVLVRTVIGKGAPNKQGTFGAHGSPLGADEVEAAKKAADWPLEPAFHVPDDVRAHLGAAAGQGDELVAAWESRLERYTEAFPEEAAELKRRLAGEVPAGWDEGLPAFSPDDGKVATRKAAGKVLQAIAERLPEVVGGSADLNPSTNTVLADAGDFQRDGDPTDEVQGASGGPWGREGRNVHYGVREHAMGAAANGMALHGGIIPYGATFLIFSDYCRPAIRLSALMRLGTVWVFTHDSVGLGEDGPTHQPIEQLASLRAIPDLLVIRPGDPNEARVAWQLAVENRSRPTALVLTRQGVPVLDRERFAAAEGVRQGAYVLNPEITEPKVILIATGSELSLAIEAAQTLSAQGHAARVVSMPCWELFAEQPATVRNAVLPPSVEARVAVEAAATFGWERWVGSRGRVVGIDRFGASAPGDRVLRELGITAERVVETALATIG